jgi:hypothetical protein
VGPFYFQVLVVKHRYRTDARWSEKALLQFWHIVSALLIRIGSSASVILLILYLGPWEGILCGYTILSMVILRQRQIYTILKLRSLCCCLHKLCLLSSSQHHDWVTLLLLELQQKLSTDVYLVFAQNFGQILVYLHSLFGTDKVSRESWEFMMKAMTWQFITDIHIDMTTLRLVVVPSKCFCGIRSAVL